MKTPVRKKLVTKLVTDPGIEALVPMPKWQRPSEYMAVMRWKKQLMETAENNSIAGITQARYTLSLLRRTNGARTM